MAHWYRRTRVCVRVRTIVFHDTSDVPHNTKECCISLCNFIVGDNFIVVDQLASLWTCKHMYHRRCIARALARNLTYPICWGVLTDGDNWVWHPNDGTRMLNFSFFFFFCYSFLCRLTTLTILMYIVAQINYGLLVMFDTKLKTLLHYCRFKKHYFIFCHVFCMLLLRIDVSIFNMI